MLVQELLVRNILSDAEATAVQDLVWQVTRTELALERCDLQQVIVIEKTALLNVKSAGTYIVCELQRGRNLFKDCWLQEDLPYLEQFDEGSLLVVIGCLGEREGKDPGHCLFKEWHEGPLHVLEDAVNDVHVCQAAS